MKINKFILSSIIKKINLIKYPLKTKKSEALNKLNKIVLIVHKSLTKNDLKELFHFLLPNQIKSINLLNLPKKKRKVRKFKSSFFSNVKRSYKKAYLTLNSNISSLFFFDTLPTVINEG